MVLELLLLELVRHVLGLSSGRHLALPRESEAGDKWSEAWDLREVSCEQLLLSSLMVARGAIRLVWALVCGGDEPLLAVEAVELVEREELSEQELMREQAWVMFGLAFGAPLLVTVVGTDG